MKINQITSKVSEVNQSSQQKFVNPQIQSIPQRPTTITTFTQPPPIYRAPPPPPQVSIVPIKFSSNPQYPPQNYPVYPQTSNFYPSQFDNQRPPRIFSTPSNPNYSGSIVNPQNHAMIGSNPHNHSQSNLSKSMKPTIGGNWYVSSDENKCRCCGRNCECNNKRFW